MSILGIQQDYGGFDPKFVGITIKIRSAENWERLINPALQDKNLILSKPIDKAFEALSISTVYEHEMRHFHDFLITPYSNHLFRCRIQSLLNGIQVITSLCGKDVDYNFVPVPLSKWCRKSHEEREKQLKRWSRFLPRNSLKNISSDLLLQPPELPWLEEGWDMEGLTLINGKFLEDTDESFDNLIKATLAGYRVIQNFTVRDTSSNLLQPCHIFEMSAIFVQIQAIWTAFGSEAVQLFLDSLLNTEVPYATLLTALAELCARANRPLDPATLNKIVTWALLGDYSIDEWKACPTYRIAELFELLISTGLPSPSRTVMSLFNEWSERLGLSQVSRGLSRTLQQNETFLNKLEASYEDAIKTDRARMFSSTAEKVIKLMRNVVEANKFMIERFLADPEMYTNPGLYLENVHQFVDPPGNVEFKDISLAGTEEFFEKCGMVIRFAEVMEDNRLRVMRAKLPLRPIGVELIDPELSDDVYVSMLWIDHYFSEMRNDEDFAEYVKMSLHSMRKTLEVLY